MTGKYYRRVIKNNIIFLAPFCLAYAMCYYNISAIITKITKVLKLLAYKMNTLINAFNLLVNGMYQII